MQTSLPKNDLTKPTVGLFSLPVIVAALGYFVDIYDLLLFGIVRVPSLTSLGLNAEQISTEGTRIINWQMGGLLLGGILWGVLGDKRGRLSVLFGSIITYSLANIACGFIPKVTFMDPVTYYALMRFIAGVGLSGAVVAYFTVKLFDWPTAFFIGGGMGIGLLLLRVGVVESGMFKNVSADSSVVKGNFLAFFTTADRFSRYMKCIGLGIPTWFVIGVLATFANEFGAALGITEAIQPGQAIMWCYIGLSTGDLASGFISQALASRKKAVTLLMLLTLAATVVYLFVGLKTALAMYLTCMVLGFGIGYWAMFVTIGAEQFGTNLRATAATTIPNMVRGLTIPMTLLYQGLKPGFGPLHAAATVGFIAFALGFYSILTISETHGKEMDFIEE